MGIEIREHVPGEDVAPFIRAADVVFEGDPAWIAPLEFELKERLSPKKNPFFKRGEVALFTAWKDGKLVGRASASVDREHLRLHKDGAGFFGFFDTVDDDEVGRRLIDAAAVWLKRRGCTQMRGPLSLYVNEELGCLIEGFEHPPYLLMAHSRSWQGKVIEAAGLVKEKDFFAWRYDVGDINKRALKAWEQTRALPEVRLRTVDTSRMQEELETIMEIFNDAWVDNWGFVPALPDEVEKTAKDLKMLIDPNLAFIAEVDGRPMGMCIALPNLNEVIRDFDGKLFPLNFAKLIWRLKVKRPKTARLMMLGIRRELRGVKKYGGLSMAMYVEIARRGQSLGYQWGELSWTLEDNAPVNLGIRAMGASVYKKYRVYSKPLA